ncbi:MAG: MerR family transcriptional regulator [Chitinophagales bacterium]
MANYSIKEIEHLSGVKAPTLRMWEQRYSILQPKRTETNIRYYTDDDLKFILNISILNKHGIRIGTIAKMSMETILEQVNKLSDTNLRYDLKINSLTTAMIEIDEDSFEKIMSTCILQHGFEDTMLKIIYPFLEKIGIMWMTGNINPAQEHFISNLIRQKVIVAIDGQVVRNTPETKHYLLFLPEGELHELSLLFLSYMLKTRNNKVTYLGASVPLKDAVEVVKLRKPDYVYTIITSAPSSSIKKYVTEIANSLEEQTILISGQRVKNLKFDLPTNVVVFKRIDEIFEFMEKHSVPVGFAKTARSFKIAREKKEEGEKPKGTRVSNGVSPKQNTKYDKD